MDVMTGEWTGPHVVGELHVVSLRIASLERGSALFDLCVPRGDLIHAKTGDAENVVKISLHGRCTLCSPTWASLTLSSFSLYRSRRGCGLVVKVVK